MFYVIIRGRDCEKYLEKCIRSLEKQSYQNFQEVIILDNPTDNSVKLAQDLKINGRTLFYHNHPKRMGLAYNMWFGVEYAKTHFDIKPDDVIAILDADDSLAKRSLHVVNKSYKLSDCLCTYGSYIKRTKGAKTKISRPYKKDAVVRRDKWHGSHLKTFKFKVWEYIDETCFQDDAGNWGEACSDLALFFSVAERAGIENCVHIPEAIYYWNNNYSGSTKLDDQKKWDKIFRGKKRLERVF